MGGVFAHRCDGLGTQFRPAQTIEKPPGSLPQLSVFSFPKAAAPAQESSSYNPLPPWRAGAAFDPHVSGKGEPITTRKAVERSIVHPTDCPP